MGQHKILSHCAEWHAIWNCYLFLEFFHLMLTDCGNWNYRELKQGLTTTFGIFEFQHWDAEANLVLSNKHAHKRQTVQLFMMLLRGCNTSLDYLCQNHLGRFSNAYAAELESSGINQRSTISLVTQESLMSIFVSKLLWGQNYPPGMTGYCLDISVGMVTCKRPIQDQIY